MKIYLRPLLCVLLYASLLSSCKKKNKDVLPQQNAKCPLQAIDAPHGNVKTFEWVGNRLVRMFFKDDEPIIAVFKYNTKGQVDIMDITAQTSSEKYQVKFTYNDKNQVTKTNVSIGLYPFLTNEFTYNEIGNIGSVKTVVEIFGKKLNTKTRVEYIKGNVARVTATLEGEAEKTAYLGDKYDDKIQFVPEQYKIAALGFVGLSNSYFSYLSANNMTKCKIYDENGKVNQDTEISYIYDLKGLPKQSESITVSGSVKKVEVCSYRFDCK